MINQVILVGRLGQAPDIKYTTNGLAIARLSVATSEYFKDNTGNRQERTEWHNIKVFGVQAEHCSKYLAKGQEVFVEGKIQSTKYTDKQGIQRTLYEIIASRVLYIGGNKKDSGNNNAPQQMQYTQASQAPVEVVDPSQLTPEELAQEMQYQQEVFEHSQAVQARNKGYYQDYTQQPNFKSPQQNTQTRQEQRPVDAVPF